MAKNLSFFEWRSGLVAAVEKLAKNKPQRNYLFLRNAMRARVRITQLQRIKAEASCFVSNDK
jgi:hypothetical protein